MTTLKFGGPTGANQAAQAAPAQAQSAPAQQQSALPNPTMPKWAASGAAAQKMMAEEKARAEAREEERDRLWRFSLKPGEGATIVFLDGAVEQHGPQKGMLLAPFFREHTVKTGPRKWDNFICLTMIDEPCPICEQTGRDGDLCAAFTVVDTTERHGKNGKVYRNQRRLFIAKQQTYQALQAIASATGQLAGTIINVARTGDRVARVGDVLVPTGHLTLDQIAQEFGEDFAKPTDFDKELQIVPADALIKLGVVAATPAVGQGLPGAPPAKSFGGPAGPTAATNGSGSTPF